MRDGHADLYAIWIELREVLQHRSDNKVSILSQSREFSIYHVSFKKILSKISMYDEYVNAVEFNISLVYRKLHLH